VSSDHGLWILALGFGLSVGVARGGAFVFSFCIYTLRQLRRSTGEREYSETEYIVDTTPKIVHLTNH
jgi:hypothetical protein